jgi:Sulfotransferase domain
MSVRIAMWSGPRNISTAMMRSFSSRSDCQVTDEPFYGAYLKTTGEPHAMAAEIISDMDVDWQSVAATMRGPIPDGKAVWYQKHMSHHMEGPISVDDFPDHCHIFLVRDPDLMVASYRQKNDLRNANQLGFERLVEYHDRISEKMGRPAPVVDSNRLLANPELGLRALCKAIGIVWDPAMLSWPKGPHPSDGIWASHWYNAVWNSTSFGKPTAPSKLTMHEQQIADECRPHYDALTRYCINTKF